MVRSHRTKLFKLAAVAIGFPATYRLLWVLAGMSGWSLVTAGQDAAPVALVLDRPDHDFWDVEIGRTLEATFRITNRGGRRLVLQQLSSSCDCISIGFAEIIVPPGGNRELPIQLHAGSLPGSYRMEVRYRTNDPDRPVLTISLSAQVVTAAAAEIDAASTDPTWLTPGLGAW